MNLSELKEKSIGDLNTIARDLGVQNSRLRKQELIFKSSNPNRRRMV